MSETRTDVRETGGVWEGRMIKGINIPRPPYLSSYS